MSIKKHFNFLWLLYNKKKNIPCDFLIDEIEVHSYVFSQFLVDDYVVQKRALRLSKRLFRETYSINFTFEPCIGYQSSKLTAELYLTRKNPFYSLPHSQICQNSPEKAFFHRFLEDFQSSKPWMVRFWNKISRDLL